MARAGRPARDPGTSTRIGELQPARCTGKLWHTPGRYSRELRALPGARAMRNSRTLGQVDLNVLDSSKR